MMNLTNKALTISALLLCLEGHATNYYVSNSGNNTNTGSYTQPFLTIQKGLDSAETPGDTVYIIEGIYYEQLNFPHNGGADQKIVLTTWQNGKVIVDGSQIPESEGIFIKIIKKSHIVVQGLTFRNFVNRPGKSIGLAIIGGSTGVEILNNEFFNFTPLDTVWGELKGIAVFSHENQAVSNYKISGNKLTKITCGQSEVLTQNGFVVNFDVAENEVTDCSVNPILQCAGGYDIEFADGYRTDSLGLPRNGVFRNNHVHNNTRGFGPKAIYVDGGENILIESNLIVNNAVGIGLHTEEIRAIETDNIVIRNNVLYDNFFSLSIGNDPGIIPDRPPGAVDSIFIYHNTIVKTMRGIELERSRSSNVFLYNNIFWQEYGEFNDPVIYCISDSVNNFLTDYNLYFTGDNEPVRFKYLNTNYPNITSFSNATGNETAGLFADPEFVVFPSDLRLKNISPAIDAGTIDFTCDVDFDGTTRPATGGLPDIGAFEFGAATITFGIYPLPAVRIFPNPASSIIHIIALNTSGDSTYQIFDTRMRLVQTGLFNHSSIDVSSLSGGIYLLAVHGSVIRVVVR